MTNVSAITNAIRDIKPPVAVPSGWEWLWWTLGVLVVAGLVILIWQLLKRRVVAPPQYPIVPAHVRARQRLDEALRLISEPKPFCTAVSDAVRSYLEERFDFHAPERTTEEFLHELQGTDLLLPDQKESLGEFLKRCDLVKFARYEPREAELRDLHAAAMRLVDETEPAPEPETANAGSRT